MDLGTFLGPAAGILVNLGGGGGGGGEGGHDVALQLADLDSTPACVANLEFLLNLDWVRGRGGEGGREGGWEEERV